MLVVSRRTGCPAASSASSVSTSGARRSVAIATNARSCRIRRGGPSGSSTTGSAPLPCLPVLSATAVRSTDQRRERRRQDHRQLVASVGDRRADERAELEAGVRVVLLPAPFGHRRARRQRVARGRADERRRHEPEERQRREPATDVGGIEEHLAIAASFGELLQRRARIGDGDELASRAPSPSASDMRDQKKRSIDATSTVPPLLLATRNSVLLRLHARRRARDRALVGRVEHEELGDALGDAEHGAHDLGAQAAAAHAEQVDGLESSRRRAVRERDRRDRGAAPSSWRHRASPGASRSSAASELPGSAPHTVMSRPRSGRRRGRGASGREFGGGLVAECHKAFFNG